MTVAWPVKTLEHEAPWLAALLDIAVSAGKLTLDFYAGAIETLHKSDCSPVTQADLASHDYICAALKKLSDWPILSEEGEAPEFEQRARWNCYWLIDPLDGTREFIAKTGEFTVNIALIVAGQVVFGVVYSPVTDELYWAIADDQTIARPATLQQYRAFKVVNGLIKPLTASAVLSHLGARVLTSRFHDQANDPLLNLVNVASRTAVGSSLKMCRIAEGQADIYIRRGPTSQWDTAAAQVILECAGGRLVCLGDGLPLDYWPRASFLNPEFVALAPNLDFCGLWLEPVLVEK
ncbi:MAG: 3'(2'),5'-bisphosphate nucleotidase CysQ [Marinagarivorans sp.]|nr:3'(2'),5'-bisphosphate nucleotidase CysQ [Marinagarivorans sp.]